MERASSNLTEVLAGHMAPEEDLREERGKSLGVKSIGPWLSFIFVINQIYGPGVLAIPIVYLQSGLVPTLIMVTFFLLTSSMASTCLAQAIASIPDNRQYQQRVEFGTAVEYYYGHKWHVVFQICLNITVQAYNIASVVICAQSIDQAFVAMAGRTFAFEFGPDIGFHSYDNLDMLYSSNHVAITVGYALITLIFMPAGFLNLNDNVRTVQVGSFIFLILLMGEFIGFFIWRGHTETGFQVIPAVGSSFEQLVSVFIFSWAYVIFIPSWLNEKSVETSVNKVVWGAGIASWFGYIAIGWLCATVFTQSEIGSDNVLDLLSKGHMPMITRITAHLFSLGVIAPGIPVCSVTTRYNLFVGGVCGKKQSYFWGCIAPWIVGFIFIQGEIFANLLNWTSLIFNGLVNFIVPFLMYLTSLKMVHAHAHAGPLKTDGSPDSINTFPTVKSFNSSPSTPTKSSDDDEDVFTPTPIVVVPSHSSANLQVPLLADGGSFLPNDKPTAHCDNVALRMRVDESATNVSSSWCSSVQDRDYSHGPVFPFPPFLQPYAWHCVVLLLIATQGVITAQTIGDIYWAANGKNVLG